MSHPDQPDKTVWDVFQEERSSLVVTPKPFLGYLEKTVSVARTCLVRFDRNKYSVDPKAIGRPVQINAYANRIVIRQNEQIVAEHDRCFGWGKAIYNPWHYVPVLARKPGALRNGGRLKSLSCRWIVYEPELHFGGGYSGSRSGGMAQRDHAQLSRHRLLHHCPRLGV